MSLKNKTILVTGAAKRIGRALSLAIARAGGNVLIHHNHSQPESETLKQEIETIGQTADVFQADFSNSGETISVINEIIKKHKLYAIVNNASVFSDLNWSNTTLEDWEYHQAVNLTAPFLISQAFAKSLLPDKPGRIVNILDWRALRPGKDHFPYTISKAALASLTESLASSLAPLITVNGIALGAILPPNDGGSIEKTISALPIDRWGNMSELEETLLFLLTGPAYITGEIIHLDGGRHLV